MLYWDQVIPITNPNGKEDPRMKKSILSIALVLCMVLALLPAGV